LLISRVRRARYVRGVTRHWVVALVILFSGCQHAQTSPHGRLGAKLGSIDGIVRSYRGIQLEDVAIVVRSALLAFERTAITDATGHFHVDGLPPALDYQISLRYADVTNQFSRVRVLAAHTTSISSTIVPPNGRHLLPPARTPWCSDPRARTTEVCWP
jgi:hypothetical protein